MTLSLGMVLGGNNPVSVAPPVTTTLTTVNGVSKYNNVTVSGSPADNFSCTNGDSHHQSVRATNGRSGKRMFEATVTTPPNTNQWIAVGVDDGTTNFNAATPVMPGVENALGVVLIMQPTVAGWGWIVDYNGVTQATGNGFVAQTGDALSCVADNSTTAGTHTVTFYITRSGSTTLLGSATGLTLPATYYAFVGVSSDACAGSVNFGATAFARTLGGGESAYS